MKKSSTMMLLEKLINDVPRFKAFYKKIQGFPDQKDQPLKQIGRFIAGSLSRANDEEISEPERQDALQATRSTLAIIEEILSSSDEQTKNLVKERVFSNVFLISQHWEEIANISGPKTKKIVDEIQREKSHWNF